MISSYRTIVYGEEYFNLAFILIFLIFAHNVNDAMKNKVIVNFMFVSCFVSLWRFPDVVKKKMVVVLFMVENLSSWGSLNCLGFTKHLLLSCSFPLGLKLKLSRAAIALKYILYSIRKHNMSFQNLIEQHKAN